MWQCLYVWVRVCLHTQLNLVPLKRLCKTLAFSRRLQQNYDIIGSIAFCAHQRLVKRSQSLVQPRENGAPKSIRPQQCP